MRVIGIDPDSDKHGVAIYENKKLVALANWSLMEIYDFLKDCEFKDTLFSIENVKAVSAAFNARDRKTNQNVKLKMAQHIGQCKQAQIELEKMLEYFNVTFVHFPISKQWKKNKAQFEKVTGWTGRSNEDSRSAAYFGFLALQYKQK